MCGVIGIVGPLDVQKEGPVTWAAYEAYRGLLTLQHRGQDAAGLLSWDPLQRKFNQQKDLGLVADVFDKEKLEKMTGPMSIAHTRYATTGGDGKEDLQPLVTGFPFGMGMVHNGNVINDEQLVKELTSEFHLQFLTENDLEIFLNIWCLRLGAAYQDQTKSFEFKKATSAAQEVFERVRGGYALLGLVAGHGLFAMRDPKGIRPLVLGRKEVETANSKKYAYCICSETLALNFLGYEYIRDIAPGEFIFIDTEGEINSYIMQGQRPKKQASCMFEWVYFSGAESSIEGKSVYGARLNLGRQLAKRLAPLIEKGELKPDVVCPVPDTSRTASIALSEELGLPYREALIKNRYIQRSFILNSQEAREKAVELKLSPIRSEIEGKSILLVDDSVVRGTTSKKIISLLKRFGAKDITLAVTCPPIRYPCYYGIDFPSPTELMAGEKSIEEMADWIGANRVVFLEESDIMEAIGLSELCMACLNNQYPTSIEGSESFAQRRRMKKG